MGLLKDLRPSLGREWGGHWTSVSLCKALELWGGAVDVGVLPQCRQRGSCRFSPGKG